MVSLKSFKLINEAERDEGTSNRDHQNWPNTANNNSNRNYLSTFSPAQAIDNNKNTQQRSKNHVPIGNEPLNDSAQNNNIMPQNINQHSKGCDNEDDEEEQVDANNEMASEQKHEQQHKTMKPSNQLSSEPSGSIVKVSIPSKSNAVYNKQASGPESLSSSDVGGAKVSPSSSSISIVVVRHGSDTANNARQTAATTSSDDDYTESSNQSFGELEDTEFQSTQVNHRTVELGATTIADTFYDSTGDSTVTHNGIRMFPQASVKEAEPRLPGIDDPRLAITCGAEHFEIVWSNLRYRIEPKWYKKINFIDRVFTHFMPGQTIDNHSSATSTASSSAGMNDNQHQMHTSANADSHLHSNLNPKQKSSLDPIEIFANLNGTIKSGQMTAVLGPSGAGKTTLLNCLTGKLRNGVSGHINLLGANGKNLKMCTIPQKDHLLELLTVEENLWFASKIKNPEYGFDHVKNIERVIDLLGLKRCRSAKIKKISGGQHKRVSIAQELLSNPDILVLDEPTSGLDSLTCFKTISMLRDLVELSANNDFMKPMAIIVTIHQPQPKVFNLFHHVYILANGGRVIYEGAPERSLETITCVTGLQPLDNTKTASLAPGNVDPASFLIEIASEEYGAEPIKTLNDYHRRVFFETNHANNSQPPQFHSGGHHNNLGGGQFHLQSTQLNAKDNHGFTADSEQDLSKNRDLSTIFVPNQPSSYNTKSTKESNGNSNNNNNEKHGKNVISDDNEPRKGPKIKKRKKSTYSLESGVSSGFSSRSTDTSHSVGANSLDGSLYMTEQLLYTREANHKGRFWSHTATLTHRTLLTIRRDPLLMTSRVLFHLMIPILMGHVYGKATGAANACPHYEPEIDITQIPSLVEGKRIEYMLEELHMSIENVSMFFIIMYAFAAAVLALNALSFPLNMQVLLKETRNGWYSMSSYVLAKTLADLPLELTMPCLTMALVYPLTGQPSSYMQWRMLTICLIMTLCSLIAQTQALILGALVMNSVQTAVFVSQASQLPWVILAGFTIRIKRLSEPLKLISLTSFYRLGCEAITLTRYGFGICPCDPQEITGEPVRLVGIPDQLRTVAQYWIDSMEASKANNDTASLGETSDALTDQASSLVTTTTMVPSTSGHKTDIFQHLANQLSYANSYGVNITSCDDVAPDRIRAINLGDNWLVARIWHLFIMLIIMKVLLYYAVKFSIGIRL